MRTHTHTHAHTQNSRHDEAFSAASPLSYSLCWSPSVGVASLKSSESKSDVMLSETLERREDRSCRSQEHLRDLHDEQQQQQQQQEAAEGAILRRMWLVALQRRRKCEERNVCVLLESLSPA